MDKARLRKDYIEQRLAVPEPRRAAWSAAICGNVAKLVEAEKIARVAIFLPIRGEPDLTGLGSLVSASLALPVVAPSGRQMSFHPWKPGDALAPNRYGILEPQGGSPLSLGADDLVLVPCVALDRQGVRLGYGGGYYDTWLATSSLRAVGVVFAKFLVDALPHQPHDRHLERAVTDDGLVALQTR